MPRQRSVGRAPSRPVAAAPKPAAAPQQQRPATTYAAPPQYASPAPAPVASQGPGLFGQMASTAAGVAIGSSVGHAIDSLFSGGSSEPVAAPVQAAAVAPPQNQYNTNNCNGLAENFTSCLENNGNSMQACGWYLEQLKACQAAARQY